MWLTCIHLEHVSIKYSILLRLLLPSTKETFITTLVLGEIMQIRLFILFIETNILCTITFQILTRNKKFWFFSYQRKLVFSHGKKDLKIQENKFSFVKSMLKCSCYLESLMQSVMSIIYRTFWSYNSSWYFGKIYQLLFDLFNFSFQYLAFLDVFQFQNILKLLVKDWTVSLWSPFKQ